MKADEEIAFSGPHGPDISSARKGAKVADVPWNIRCESIRYNNSRLKGVCQALSSDLLTPLRELTSADFVNEASGLCLVSTIECGLSFWP